MRDWPAHAISELDGFVNRRRSLGAFRFGAHFEPSKCLTLFAQNTDHISGRAGAQADEYQLHRPWRGVALAVGVDHESMSAGSDGAETLAIGPIHAGSDHFYLRLSVCGSG